MPNKLRLLVAAVLATPLCFVITDSNGQVWNDPSGTSLSTTTIHRSGNVGIGTTTPFKALQLGPNKTMLLEGGNVELSYTRFINDRDQGNIIFGAFPNDPGGSAGARIACLINEGEEEFKGLTIFEAGGINGLSFRTGESNSQLSILPERMRLYSDGRVIIGTPIENISSVQRLEIHNGNALIGGYLDPLDDGDELPGDVNNLNMVGGGGGSVLLGDSSGTNSSTSNSGTPILIGDSSGTGNMMMGATSGENLRGTYRGSVNAKLFLGSENYSVYSKNGAGIGFGLGSLTYTPLFVKNNGQVNIGENTSVIHASNYKLSVDGKIVTRSVYVTESQDWPDFVFEEDYKIKSLEETEAFIKENKHLPEVPSAKEIGETGVDLGKMDAILLQKIEELTLHMIEMKKENAALKERLSKIETSQTGKK